MRKPAGHALTVAPPNGGIIRVIGHVCRICPGFSPQHVPQGQRPPYELFPAIWDTGASASVVSRRVIDKCGLKPTGMAQAHTAGGVVQTETYLVNILLPNGVGFSNMTVTRGELSAGTDILLGMDIITQGDLAITNVGGNTVFSFRVPSQVAVDFVKELGTGGMTQAAGPPRPSGNPPASWWRKKWKK